MSVRLCFILKKVKTKKKISIIWGPISIRHGEVKDPRSQAISWTGMFVLLAFSDSPPTCQGPGSGWVGLFDMMGSAYTSICLQIALSCTFFQGRLCLHG